MCTAYEEAVRVPLIIRHPKLFPAGRVWNSGVSHVDLMPTILEAAGIRTTFSMLNRTFPQIQGTSLIPRVQSGRDEWRDPVVIENVPQMAIDGGLYDERAIRHERHKLILRKFENRPVLRPGELYDLKSDPGETKNLYSSKADARKSLARSLAGWGRRSEDPLAIELGEWAD